MIFWASPKGLSHSPYPHSVAHTACFLDSSWLHSIAAADFGDHAMVLPSEKR